MASRSCFPSPLKSPWVMAALLGEVGVLKLIPLFGSGLYGKNVPSPFPRLICTVVSPVAAMSGILSPLKSANVA